ncbi:MAG TPA: response regulator [Casimicrobiaceae bacterium]|nr:response regulator [Casimicrobiaceae bacterium]
MKEAAAAPIVFIVDDDHAVRDSLALLLGLRGYATASFDSGEALLADIAPDARGCVLLDLRLTGMDGLRVQTELGARGIHLPVIILTAHGDVPAARAALKAGAFDFLEKPVDDSAMLATIDAALASEARARTRTDRRAALRARVARLTQREREVLNLVVRGQHNREIAATLGISPRTVEVYKARLMDKLHVERLPDLIRLALDLEVIAPADSR